jgi:hypothetical protein
MKTSDKLMWIIFIVVMFILAFAGCEKSTMEIFSAEDNYMLNGGVYDYKRDVYNVNFFWSGTPIDDTIFPLGIASPMYELTAYGGIQYHLGWHTISFRVTYMTVKPTFGDSLWLIGDTSAYTLFWDDSILVGWPKREGAEIVIDKIIIKGE